MIDSPSATRSRIEAMLRPVMNCCSTSLMSTLSKHHSEKHAFAQAKVVFHSSDEMMRYQKPILPLCAPAHRSLFGRRGGSLRHAVLFARRPRRQDCVSPFSVQTCPG